MVYRRQICHNAALRSYIKTRRQGADTTVSRGRHGTMNTLLFDLDRADIAASTADQRETGAVNILNIAAVPTNQRGMFFFNIVIFKKLFYLQPYFWSKLCLPVVVLWIYICADLLVHLKVAGFLN